jgi:hypothetical protein
MVTPTQMQQLHSNRRMAFSVRPMPRCYKHDKTGAAESRLVNELVSELGNRWVSAVVSLCCEKLVAEAGDSSGIQRKWNVCHWKLLPSNG